MLGELTDLSSTTGSAVMALCRGQAPHVAGQLDCMSSFLVACLDHMTASVSLMHGRLPLSESDEALQEIAECAAPPRVAHCRMLSFISAHQLLARAAVTYSRSRTV